MKPEELQKVLNGQAIGRFLPTLAAKLDEITASALKEAYRDIDDGSLTGERAVMHLMKLWSNHKLLNKLNSEVRISDAKLKEQTDG